MIVIQFRAWMTFFKLDGGQYFCTLDNNKAYLHLEVDESTAMLQALSTHKGTYKVNRLMFGIKVVPNKWQRFMDNVLNDLPGVTCFFDVIQIQGHSYMTLC